MPAPAHPQPATPLALLADAVSDHEKRLRKVERYIWGVAGAASGSGGTWLLSVIMTRR